MPVPPDAPTPLGLRARLAISAGQAVNAVSRAAHLGTGSVIGGRVSLALDPGLLRQLSAGREVVLVSATNGKTTTTALLRAALAGTGPVVSNALGANMTPGIVAALGPAAGDATAVLEVDERWLPTVLEAVGPAMVVLLNLSRDQLDRAHEVRATADLWRDTLRRLPATRVVAVADDPLVVWAAGGAAERGTEVVWVATGLHWTLDATGCPACGARVSFDGPTRWSCGGCSFARPAPDWALTDAGVQSPDGVVHPFDLVLPGRVNKANAAVAVATATSMGANADEAAAALGLLREVAGRYRVARIGAAEVRLLLAKNPAGWQEAMEMLDPPPVPVVAAINARIADGRDPSWLWDVPFEHLAGRFVVATGERRHDLAVRLAYADIDHAVADGLASAVRTITARGDTCGRIEVIANYTAFQDALDEVGR
jgi:UDP-N-acetylmuramyl tripeptide synthase